MRDYERIEYSAQLSSEALLRLIEDKTLALIVENYYPKKLAKKLALRLSQSQALEKYTHEVIENNSLIQAYFGVDRVGFPFNLIYDKDEQNCLTEDYYLQAPKSMKQIRNFVKPAFTPIDKFRLELDENYIYGAMVANFQARKMLAGIGRVANADLSYLSAEEPHYDALPEKFCALDAQFACNIYLAIPETGGELELWDVDPLPPFASVPKKWRQALPASILLAPKVGDLILFNCRRPHAIRGFQGEPRVTMQTFIGYRAKQPLLVWN